MELTITHILDTIREVIQAVRQVGKNGFDDRSLAIWDATRAMCRETAVMART